MAQFIELTGTKDTRIYVNLDHLAGFFRYEGQQVTLLKYIVPGLRGKLDRTVETPAEILEKISAITRQS